MLQNLPNILMPILVLVAVGFLLFRFRFFSTRNLGGKYLYLSGAIVIFLAASWQWVRLIPEYSRWFIPGAYTVIDLVQLGLLILGGLLAVAGLSLYADFWQVRSEEIQRREGKLTVLENLQRDAREPYQLLDLVNIALKEIIYHSGGTAGAIFLLNRKRRQLVLTSAVGLNQQETAHLEYYPLDGNIVYQSVELAEPLIAADFDFVDRAGKQVPSRFRSVLVLPLISGLDKIGGILLFSTEEKFFTGSEIRVLSPVAEWLAEKIKSARLVRELSLANRQVGQISEQLSDTAARLLTAVEAFGARDAVSAFCRGLIGIADSESTHLFGMRYGALHFHGGSEPLTDLSENYRTALITALGKKKPLVINQEATDEDNRPRIIASSLIYPFERDGKQEALLFRRSSAPFTVDDRQLQIVELFSHLALLILGRDSAARLAITRRVGLEKVLGLLQFDGDEIQTDAPSAFVRYLSDALPDKSIGLTFVKADDGHFRVVDGIPTDRDTFDEFAIMAGEGAIGETALNREEMFTFGRNAVSRELERYEVVNRSAFARLFGEQGTPSFLAVCPITSASTASGIAVIFMYNVDEAERGEWERFLTLISGLWTLRQTMTGLRQEPAAAPPVVAYNADAAINQLNNHLAAIVGQAELASRNTEASEVHNALERIIAEAGRTGQAVAAVLKGSETGELPADAGPVEAGINGIIRDILSRINISGDLYMAGGRPREVSANLRDTEEITVAHDKLRDLFEAVINRFTALASEEDVISVDTYQKEDHVYLDISRHRKNFPAVLPVADFGVYESAQQALQNRPADVYLKHIADEPGFYAADQNGQTPAYLSFKFPLKPTREVSVPNVETDRIKILSIDDESVILDLVSAMCQTLGYAVETAQSGTEGLALFAQSDFDMILTDLAMPGMSGLDVAREVRKLNSQVPIILVTGWEASLSPESLKSAGITEVLYKPFRIEQLTRIIQSAAPSPLK